MMAVIGLCSTLVFLHTLCRLSVLYQRAKQFNHARGLVQTKITGSRYNINKNVDWDIKHSEQINSYFLFISMTLDACMN